MLKLILKSFQKNTKVYSTSLKINGNLSQGRVDHGNVWWKA
jgi:hypothetical protein